MRSRSVVAILASVLAVLVSLLLLSPALSREGARQGRYVIGAADDTTTPFNLVSLPALFAHRYDGRDLERVQLLRRNRIAEQWRIGYLGNGLRLSGTLLVPRTRGAHPVVVALHGWAPAPRYRTGRGLLREEWSLARHGFAVLHPDYRSYGGSWTRSTALRRPIARPLGYPADVLTAVTALRRAHLRGIDTRRIGLFGRSMGGGVALQVAEARPAWFRSMLLYSPVSAEAGSDFDRWVAPDASLRRRVTAAYGSPTSDPDFYASASSANYLARLTMPVAIHHGTADPMCPAAWSEQTYTQMREAGVRVTLDEYAGEVHRFSRAWPRFMSRADRFFARTLR